MSNKWSTHSFPHLIVSQREVLGMTQGELAARVGVNEGFMSRIENGKKLPTEELASAIEIVLNLPKGLLVKRVETIKKVIQTNSEIAEEMGIQGIELRRVIYKY